MSNTKGSMLISNANAVGTELVNQLGGTGYKPSKWSDAINLLGISDDDKASALAGITEGTYTGTERGAIKYSNCNAVGSMLNKKFSTDRGFKPVEWESAISKLTPLAEGTVSGSICNIVNGADDVPLKNWLVTLPASLSGYSEVNAVRSGKNLVDGYIDYNITTKIVEPVFLKAGNYTISFQRDAVVQAIYVRKGDTVSLVGDAYAYKYNSTFFAFNADVDGYYFVQLYRSGSSTTWEDAPISNVQLEVGSTATAYSAYEAPTQYTASLGRTIYGGTADIVTGEGEDENGNAFTFTPITPTPETALGVNNFWSEQGDSSVTYRKDPDIPDPPVQLLNMNNNENNNNEGV